MGKCKMKYRCMVCGIDFVDTMFESARQRAIMHAKTRHPKAQVWKVISEIWA